MSEKYKSLADLRITDSHDHLPQNRIGMTVREEIASRVLAGMMNSTGSHPSNAPESAKRAVIFADALIEELERTKK